MCTDDTTLPPDLPPPGLLARYGDEWTIRDLGDRKTASRDRTVSDVVVACTWADLADRLREATAK